MNGDTRFAIATRIWMRTGFFSKISWSNSVPCGTILYPLKMLFDFLPWTADILSEIALELICSLYLYLSQPMQKNWTKDCLCVPLNVGCFIEALFYVWQLSSCKILLDSWYDNFVFNLFFKMWIKCSSNTSLVGIFLPPVIMLQLLFYHT